MVNVLLNLVVVKGVHIAAREEVKKKWNEVNDDLYLNPPFVGYKSVHYRKGDYRNLQEKYKRVKAAVVEDMHAGNKSKYTGDLSQQYALIEQICQEIETQAELRNAKKEDAADLEKALRETEAKVLRKKEYGKRKNIDGTITDYTDGKRKAQGLSNITMSGNFNNERSFRISSRRNRKKILQSDSVKLSNVLLKERESRRTLYVITQNNVEI